MMSRCLGDLLEIYPARQLQPERDWAFMGSTWSTIEKNPLGTHAGNWVVMDLIGWVPHPGRPSKSQAVIGILLIRLF
jgi:hypothetical protein